MYCYHVAEGDDHHHRISQGEIYFECGDEKLCLPCAERRAILQRQAPRLREPIPGRAIHAAATTDTYPVHEAPATRGDDLAPPPQRPPLLFP